MLNTSVLVLNRLFLPIHVTSVRRAFTLIYQGGARAVDASYQTFDFDAWRERGRSVRAANGASGNGAAAMEEVVGTVDGVIAIPPVIVLTHYDRVPRRHVRFSRLNIFSRDRFTCQYCAVRPSRSELNLDHVIPRSQGGRTTWENVVCCCVSCNRRKGGRTPEQAGLPLRRRPARPRWTPLMNLGGAARRSEWAPFLAIADPAAKSAPGEASRVAS